MIGAAQAMSDPFEEFGNFLEEAADFVLSLPRLLLGALTFAIGCVVAWELRMALWPIIGDARRELWKALFEALRQFV